MTLFCWILGLYITYTGGSHMSWLKNQEDSIKPYILQGSFIKLIGDRKRSFQSSFTVLTLLLHTTHEISYKKIVSVVGKKKNKQNST